MNGCVCVGGVGCVGVCAGCVCGGMQVCVLGV